MTNKLKVPGLQLSAPEVRIDRWLAGMAGERASRTLPEAHMFLRQALMYERRDWAVLQVETQLEEAERGVQAPIAVPRNKVPHIPIDPVLNEASRVDTPEFTLQFAPDQANQRTQMDATAQASNTQTFSSSRAGVTQTYTQVAQPSSVPKVNPILASQSTATPTVGGPDTWEAVESDNSAPVVETSSSDAPAEPPATPDIKSVSAPIETSTEALANQARQAIEGAYDETTR